MNNYWEISEVSEESDVKSEIMSQHMNIKYVRSFRKSTQEQGGDDPPKQAKTAAERSRDYRVRKKVAKGEASSTAGWDAGEGPSTRGRKS